MPDSHFRQVTNRQKRWVRRNLLGIGNKGLIPSATEVNKDHYGNFNKRVLRVDFLRGTMIKLDYPTPTHQTIFIHIVLQITIPFSSDLVLLGKISDICSKDLSNAMTLGNKYLYLYMTSEKNIFNVKRRHVWKMVVGFYACMFVFC